MKHRIAIQIGRTQIPLEFDPTRKDISRVLEEIIAILKVGFAEEAIRRLHYRKSEGAFNVRIEINFDGYVKSFEVLIESDTFVEVMDSIKERLSTISPEVERELLYSTLREAMPIIKLAD